MKEEMNFSEKQSLELITGMINRAKQVCHDTGIGAIMWGAVIAVCSLVKLSEIHFGYRLPFDIYILTLIAIIPQVFISIKEKKERRVSMYEDVYNNYLWLGFGICIVLLILIINVIFDNWQQAAMASPGMYGPSASFQFYDYVAPLFLMLYGLPTFVTGVALKFRPMFWGGIICWACCIATVFTGIKIDLLLTAFSSVSAWLIPGIIIEKDYRKAKKELAVANV